LTTTRLLAVGVWLVAIYAGCQSESGAPVAAPAGTAAPVPQHLVRDIVADPKTFNPVLVTDNASNEAIEFLFESLIRLNPRTNEMEPALAERWEHDEAGTVWTFFIRHGVKWQDGQPLTARDVRFSFDVVYDPRIANSAVHLLIMDKQKILVEVIDDYTVRFTLPRPFAPLLFGISSVAIVPEHVLGPHLQAGTFTQQWGIDTPPAQLVGTGPYRMVKYEPAQYIKLQRNPDYWMRDENGHALPYLDEQTILIVQNQDTELLKFLAGEIHLLNPRPEDVPSLRERAPTLGINVQEIGLDSGALFVVLNRNPNHYERNGKRDPRLTWFTDKAFLRALAHSIDTDALVLNCFQGFGERAVAYITPENKLFYNPTLTPYEYNLEKARAILTEAGYIDRDQDGVIEDREGNPVAFTLNTNSGNQIREKMCSIIKEDWTQLGIRVNYRPLDWTLLSDKLDVTFDWDAILIGFTGGLEPNTAANLLRSNGNLHMWYPNQEKPVTPWEAEIDELLDQGSREIDALKRQPKYWRIQEILHDELPLLMLVQQKRFRAFKNTLENFFPTVWGIYHPERIRFTQ
jgi:peptide/nickel transport system substrate-binding protein